MASLMPQGKQRYTDNNGNNLSGGKVFAYAAGTSTPLDTYSDQAGTIPNTNPVVLNARGEATIFWGSSAYKVVLKDASDVEIWTQDNLQASTGVADLASTSATKGAALVGFDGGTLADYIKNKSAQVVNSISALKAIDKTKFTRALTTGYYAAGDGGHGAYWFDSTDTTSADNGGTIIVATDSGRWKLIHHGVVSVLQFGAKGDGTTDDTTSIQAAINSGVKRITSAFGRVHKTTDALTINADAVVLEFDMASIDLNDATGLKNHITVGDGATQRNGVEIRRVTFTRAQAATAGAAVRMSYVGVAKIIGNRIFGNSEIFNGISITRGIIVDIEDNYIDNCINKGIYLEGTGSGANSTIDVSIRENRVEGGVTALDTWDFVEGLFCRDNIFFNTSGSCAVISASTNANGLSSFKLQDNDFDTVGGVGLYIDMVSNVQVSGCWFAGTVGTALVIKNNVDSCIIASNQFYPSAIGIEVGGNAARVSSNLVSGGTKCVLVKGTATRTGISSNTLTGAQTAIDLAENPTGVHIVGNDFTNMSVSWIADHVTPNARSIQNNQGDSGLGATSFITVGASPFTYTAGNRPEMVSIFSGTVSEIQTGGNSIGFTTNRTVILVPRATLTVTYSSLPFMTKTAF